MASLRDQLVDRLVTMSTRHAEYAWSTRRERPVGPHALVFLYADAVTPGWHRLVAATRMVYDDAHSRNLPRLLHRFATLARDRYVAGPGGFNPGRQLANRHDRSSGRATYFGLGVSTLDTPAGDWASVLAGAREAGEVPGRVLAVLLDGTWLLADRACTRDGSEVTVHSTTPVGAAPGRWLQYHASVETMPAPSPPWRRLLDLHALVVDQPTRPTL
jgi:hypothetical protein